MSAGWKIALGAVVISVGLGTAMSAQRAVTFTMTSGDKVPVTLIDLGAGGFEVESRGATRKIPKDQVAMVDFGGNVRENASWFRDMTPLDHLVVFKNGDTMLTEWVDVGGTSPLILRFNTGRGEREMPDTEVARIYLVKPRVQDRPNEDDAQGGGMQSDGSVRVVANQAWTSTRINVRTGEFLRFEVSREIKFGNGDNDVATADGFSGGRNRAMFRGLPVASLPVGGLIGRVNNSQPFSIGSAPQPIRMPQNGTLFLGINDVTFDDNSGWFRVVILNR